MPSNKTFRTKVILAKANKQNRPIPQWFRLKSDTKIQYNAKRRHWRRTKLKYEEALPFDIPRPTGRLTYATDAKSYWFWSNDAARTNQEGEMNEFLRNQAVLTKKMLDRRSSGRPSYESLWEGHTQRERENLFLRAGEAKRKTQRECVDQLFANELRMDALCGGNGVGFGRLLRELCFTRSELCQETLVPKRLMHAQWDRWFGQDDFVDDSLPLPAGLRNFATTMVTWRMEALLGTMLAIQNFLDGKKTFNEKTGAYLQYRDDLDRLFLSAQVLGAHSDSTIASDAFLNQTFEEHIETSLETFRNEANACDYCSHIETEEHGKLLWCSACRHQGRWSVPISRLEATTQGAMWEALSLGYTGLKSEAPLEQDEPSRSRKSVWDRLPGVSEFVVI
ncbi:large subunit ribosomal protein L39e, partial [Phenoliferia sp. Uapishka_3]